MESAREALERVFREESGRILAGLIRALGDFDAAEEALHEALLVALELWGGERTAPGDAGALPPNPGAWIAKVAKNKALERFRRERLRQESEEFLIAHGRATGRDTESELEERLERLDSSLEDDRLRLIFTCCHPALDRDAQVPLTLRSLCGLETKEIARAFLVPAPTLAQRLVRAKKKIKEAGIPYRVPPDELLHERTDAVLTVIYLVFNEGYAASSGAGLLRADLCAEGIRLARLLSELMPGEPEVLGLLSLLLFQDARRAARVSSDGELVLLEDQDRSLWDRTAIEEGSLLLERALRMGRAGAYQVQAAISALHATAATALETDWTEIAGLYRELERLHPSPVVALNRAVAVSMAEGPGRGFQLLERIERAGALRRYHYFHSARGELLRRLGREAEAREAWQSALDLAENEAERRFLERRLRG